MTHARHEHQEQSQVLEILQAWQRLGEELFANGDTIIGPKLATVRAKVVLFAADVALTKHDGNLTHASQELGTSRRALRDKLKEADRYPWQPAWTHEHSAT